jgi:hypothetical protein
MPFTLSHPAAVIPIRKFGVLSALVIGSMMPDTLYFMPNVSAHDWYGHTPAGIVFYCLPAGLALLWLFHAFLKGPLISLFPEAQQRKLHAVSPRFSFMPIRRTALLAFSMLLGAASHVTWDAFTHSSQAGAQMFPVLRRVVVIPGHAPFLLADFLQLVSSVLGLGIILFYYVRWLRNAEERDVKIHLPAWARAVLVFFFFTGALVPMTKWALLNPAVWNFKRVLLGYAAVTGIKVMCVEILVFCAAWHLAFGGGDASPMSHSTSA